MKGWVFPILVGLAISVIAGAILIPWALKGQHLQDELESRGVRTQGTIVSVDPANHAQCTYAFVAGKTRYQSVGGDCATLPVGGSISVYYLPDDPNISTNGDPSTSDPGAWLFVFGGVVMLPAIAIFALIRRRRPRDAQAN